MSMEAAIYLSLDRSGSMESCRDVITAGVNDFLGKLRGDETTRYAQFILTQWDNQGFDIIRRGVIEDIADLGPREFTPRALTPLLDSTAFAVDQLKLAQSKKNMLILVTDGMENASKTWRYPAVKKLLEDKQKEGWIIIYLAAHIDAWSQAEEIGIPRERAMNFKAGAGSVPRTGWTARFRKNQTTNPFGLALLACGGMATAYMLLHAGEATAAVSALAGFTEAHRNEAMGVDGITTTWGQAVAEDISNFNEPFAGLFDLPTDLAQIQATLPQDFDPCKGSIAEDGTQPGQPQGDVLSEDDYDSTDDDDDDEDASSEDDEIDSGDGTDIDTGNADTRYADTKDASDTDAAPTPASSSWSDRVASNTYTPPARDDDSHTRHHSYTPATTSDADSYSGGSSGDSGGSSSGGDGGGGGGGGSD